jgi:hypothetical protein
VESFRVICETCGARLKVRDASVIGEIHACPKCESMVQILPPADWQTESTERPVAKVEPAVQPTPASDVPPMEYIEATAPTLPVAAAASPYVFWGVGGSMLVLVGLAVGLWAGGQDVGNDSKPLAPATEVNDKVEVKNHIVPDPYAVDRAADAAMVPTDKKTDDPPIEPVAQPLADDRPTPPELPPAPAEQQAAVSDTEASASSEKAESQETAAIATPKRRPPPVLRFDPLDFDPARLSLTGAASSDPQPSSGSIDDDPTSDLDVEREEELGEVEADVLPPPAGDQTLHVRLGPMPSEPPRSNAAGEQLALRVDSLELYDVPLARFIELLSDIGGGPITLDPMALELAGVSPRAAVSIQAKEGTLESLLKDALSKRRLDCIEHNGQMRIVLRNGGAKRVVDYEVKDLAGADANDFAAKIRRFVAPATWQEAGGEGAVDLDGTTLHVEQAQAVHHEILIFCERLRMARGLARRSRYPAERLSIAEPYEAISAKLHERTTFTFLPWERFADVVQYWQQETGLAILVDWSALAAAELGRSSPIACSAIDRPWQAAFDGIFEPLNLAWWAVDGETIQITTRDALAEIQRVEFYTVPESLRNQLASGELLAELSATSWELDGPSGRLIVLAPPTAHRALSQRFAGAGK